MKITIAKTAGFCMGVRRAVEMSIEASNGNDEPISSYGPLIHNPQVLGLLQEKGIEVLDRIPEKGSGTIIIRAHGVPPTAKTRLEAAGFNIIDATCPRVIRVQTIIRKHAEKGYCVIIVGDKDHPEVIGLLGYAGDLGHVVESMKDMERLPGFDKAIIVAQTTQNACFFKEIQKWAELNQPHYKVFNTICDSTEKRQEEVKKLAKSVDAMVVVGGYNSGNTRRLAQVAKEAGKEVFHIETESELDAGELESAQSIGITAGASTPNWVINNVYMKLGAFPLDRHPTGKGFLSSLQKSLVLTNLYTALGASALAYACTTMEGIKDNLSHIMVAFCYILSMHTFNNLTGRKSDRYNNPERAKFYEVNRISLAALAVFAGGSGLAFALSIGLISFYLLFAMIILGGLYNIKFLPKLSAPGKFTGIKDIPGSKTLLMILAWGVVSALLPAVTVSPGTVFRSLPVFLWAVGMAFVRTSFFDMLDIQGDRIIGKDTIPILLGEDKTKDVLDKVLAGLIILLIFSGITGIVAPPGTIQAATPALLGCIILAHEKGVLSSGLGLTFLVELDFILAGILAIAFS